MFAAAHTPRPAHLRPRLLALALPALMLGTLACSQGPANGQGATAAHASVAQSAAPITPQTPPPMPTSIHGFTVQDIDGNDVSLSQFEGKAVLIVNVASQCGLTPQYADLEQLYRTYKDRGLVVIGFPANNFGGQEPGTNEEIKAFCTGKFEVSFPMMAKISVKGDDIHPLYQYLTQKAHNGLEDAPVKWNFQKFLVGPEGRLLEVFAPTTTVENKKAVAAIEAALPS